MYLPRPYPDELIGSVIARGLVHTGLPTKKYLFSLLGRKVSTLSLFLPSSIKALANAMALDMEDVLWHHTDFPYVTAFMPRSEMNRLKAKTLGLVTSRELSLSSLVKSVTQGLSGLKYCPICRTEELEQLGESYWHRLHNLPTVEVCTRHLTALVGVDIPTRSMAFGIGQPHHYSLNAPLLEIRLCIASDLARRAEQLFEPRFEDVSWIDYYRSAAYNAGYSLTSGDLAGRQLAQDLSNYFGSIFLSQIACLVDIEAKSPWPALMLRPATSVLFSPTKHLLLQNFLASMPRENKPLNYTRPGKEKRNYHHLDTILASHMRRTMLLAEAQHIRLTVQQLVEGSKLWSAFRHQRNLFPMSCRVLEEFRRSDASERQSGQRPHRRRHLSLDRNCDFSNKEDHHN